MTAPTPVKASLITRARVLVLFAVILAALMYEDLDVIGWKPMENDACGMQEMDHSSPAEGFYTRIAGWGVHAAGSPRVAIVEIRQTDLLYDACASRSFLTELVPGLARLGAQVILIDKYYSEESCKSGTITADFKTALETSPIPVIVGAPTEKLGVSSGHSGCLAQRQDTMQFNPGKSVSQGLTRLNSNTLKIPIRWPVFNESSGKDGTADTISFVAAQAADPGIQTRAMLPTLLARQVHPYTTFINLPVISAVTAACSASDHPHDGHGNLIDCSKDRRPPHDLTPDHQSLLGKVVVIGDISDELQPFPGGDRPGYYLQANYVESLLDQRFLLEVPLPWTVGILILFIFAVYVLHWGSDHEGNAFLSSEIALVFSAVLFGLLMLSSLAALFVWQYFTPMWALWGAAFFLVFRYLEESGHHRAKHLLSSLAGEVRHGERFLEHLKDEIDPSTPTGPPTQASPPSKEER